jgi:hypothetical protein
MSADEVEQFSRYPLVWLGAEFEGLPITAVVEKRSPANPRRPAIDSVTFVYGDCEPLPDQGCPAPLQVTVMPDCSPGVSERVRRSTVDIRDISETHTLPGHLFLETAFNKVVIVSAAPDGVDMQQIERAANALRGANEIASSITADAPLNLAIAANLSSHAACDA